MGPREKARFGVGAVPVIAVVIVAGVGYAAIGFAFASTRIANADRTLDNVISHQNQLNLTFNDINTRFSSLGSGAAFNPTQAGTLIDQFIANAQAADTTVQQDDASLATAAGGLSDQRWLTAISRGNLDHEAARIAHARRALGAARTVAGDYVLDGQFLRAFMNSLIDLGTLSSESSGGDLNGAQATLGTMKAHVEETAQLATAPGLPPELHDMAADFQSLVTDYGALLTATQANDDAALAASNAKVSSDYNRLSSYNFDQINSEIRAFYQPLVAGFNSEMAAATS